VLAAVNVTCKAKDRPTGKLTEGKGFVTEMTLFEKVASSHASDQLLPSVAGLPTAVTVPSAMP
jgi:hypothetical protein